MTRQEHGFQAFVALLRGAAAGTEAPTRAWSGNLGRSVPEAKTGEPMA